MILSLFLDHPLRVRPFFQSASLYQTPPSCFFYSVTSFCPPSTISAGPFLLFALNPCLLEHFPPAQPLLCPPFQESISYPFLNGQSFCQWVFWIFIFLPWVWMMILFSLSSFSVVFFLPPRNAPFRKSPPDPVIFSIPPNFIGLLYADVQSRLLLFEGVDFGLSDLSFSSPHVPRSIWAPPPPASA